MRISLIVNGKAVAAEVEPRTHLADFLRETLHLTGTHLGCEHGVCGACTLLVDGVPVRSCITYAVACDGAEITSIEGFERDEVMSELRAAFSREHALQCGFCTPGMLISARDFILRHETAADQDIRIAMSGNLCRCTGYVGIIRAIQGVIADRASSGARPLASGGRRNLGPAGSGHTNAGGMDEGSGGMVRFASVPVAELAREKFAIHSTKADAAWTPQATINQSFKLNHSPSKVWDFFGRLEDVARCFPGASLTAPPEAGKAEGKIRVKLGPMVAEFAGYADIERDDAAYRGIIHGSGRDTRSASTTRGEIRYALIPENDGGTRVDLEIGYTLTGVLAQFSRGGLVRDLANRLSETFAQNVEKRLRWEMTGSKSDAPEPEAANELNAASLVFLAIRAQFRAVWAKLAALLRH